LPSGDDKGTVQTARALERECSALRSRLEELLAAYGWQDNDGLSPFLSRVDVDLYANLVSLASEGLKIVRGYRSHFPRVSLYSDGMFWYQLFEVINAAGGRIWKAKDEVNIPRDIVVALGDLLVKISWFSTATGGDIEVRNMEALGSIFLALGDSGWETDLRRRARAMRVKRVMQFLDETMRMVGEHRGSTQKPRRAK